jgi:hypothetical protein
VSVLTLGGDQTWNTGGAEISPHYVALNGSAWTIDGGTSASVGTIGGAGAIVVNSGDMMITFDSPFSGPVTLNNGGLLMVATAQGLGVGDGTMANGTTVNPGGGLWIVAGAPLTLAPEALTLSGAGYGSGGALKGATNHPVTFTGPMESLARPTCLADGPPA